MALAEPIVSVRERALLSQLISSEKRVRQLEAEVRKLKSENTTALQNRVKHAVRELAKRKPEILSDEEWRMVLEMRGICS